MISISQAVYHILLVKVEALQPIASQCPYRTDPPRGKGLVAKKGECHASASGLQ